LGGQKKVTTFHGKETKRPTMKTKLVQTL